MKIMDKKDFTVGQTVYLLLTGNEARYVDPDKLIITGTVTKIGRKYITVAINEWREIQFDMTNGFRQNTECCIGYILFLSKDDIAAYHTRMDNIKYIDTFFREWSWSRDVLDEDIKDLANIIRRIEYRKKEW